MSGGGSVVIDKKYYRVALLTPHKTVDPEDQANYDRSVVSWEELTGPRVRKFTEFLDRAISDETLRKLGAVAPENINWRQAKIDADGRVEERKSDPFYGSFVVLRVELPGLAAGNHAVEVQQLEIAFKSAPPPREIKKLMRGIRGALARTLQELGDGP